MIYLVEVTAATDSAGTTAVLRFSSEAYTTGPAESPANAYYDARVKTPADITRNLFSNNTTSGASRVGYGVVELINVDGGLDYMRTYGYDGRSLVIKIGNQGSAYSTFTTILSGSMEQVEFTFDKVTILARDKLAVLEQPLQKTEFAGTNSLPAGVEGTTDIKGKKKPICYGKVYNISPPCVNTSALVYQVSDLTISDIPNVYDSGVALSRLTPDFTSVAAMLAGSIPAGHYCACPTSSGSYFRLSTDPSGTLTADVTQGASASDRTVAQILKQIAIKGGVASGDINASDVTALDALNSAEVGIWIYGETTALAALDPIATSIGAWYGFDATGQFRMGRFSAPSGTANIEISRDNIISIEKMRTQDSDKGLPAYKVILSYLKNYTIQDTGLAASVTEVRHNVIRYPSLEVTATDATVQNQFLLAPEIQRDTLLIDGTAASTEATRVLNLYKVQRDLYQVRIALDVTETLPDINGVANVTLNRFGLDSGKLFRIIGISSNYATNRATLTLWG